MLPKYWFYNHFKEQRSSVATTIEITTTIEIIISTVVENKFQIATTNEITTTIEIIISIEIENSCKTKQSVAHYWKKKRLLLK